jgi:hypothetical protein
MARDDLSSPGKLPASLWPCVPAARTPPGHTPASCPLMPHPTIALTVLPSSGAAQAPNFCKRPA